MLLRSVPVLKRGTLEAYLKWLVTNKRKSGGLNYSKAITFGMPAGRGRKGERPPKSRRGRQSASLVVQRNPSSSIVANQSQNYPDGAQLHDLYPAPGQPSVAAHQIQLGSLCPTVYNPPSFPIHGTRFPHAYTPAIISSSPAKRSFPSCTPSSAIFVIPAIGSSRNMALRFVAAFVLPRGIANKC